MEPYCAHTVADNNGTNGPLFYSSPPIYTHSEIQEMWKGRKRR